MKAAKLPSLVGLVRPKQDPSSKTTRAGCTCMAGGNALAGRAMMGPTSFKEGGSGRGYSNAISAFTSVSDSSRRAAADVRSMSCLRLIRQDRIESCPIQQLLKKMCGPPPACPYSPPSRLPFDSLQCIIRIYVILYSSRTCSCTLRASVLHVFDTPNNPVYECCGARTVRGLLMAAHRTTFWRLCSSASMVRSL